MRIGIKVGDGLDMIWNEQALRRRRRGGKTWRRARKIPGRTRIVGSLRVCEMRGEREKEREGRKRLSWLSLLQGKRIYAPMSGMDARPGYRRYKVLLPIGDNPR